MTVEGGMGAEFGDGVSREDGVGGMFDDWYLCCWICGGGCGRFFECALECRSCSSRWTG